MKRNRSLIFDTETGGFPNSMPATHPSQPPLVELAAHLWEGSRLLHGLSVIVRPYNGLKYHPQAVKTHGITEEIAAEVGVNVVAAVRLFERMLRLADEVVGHNLAFDIRFMTMVYEQIGENGPPSWPLRRICTQTEAKPLLKIATAGGGLKAPSLAEAYAHATDQQLENAHSAAADVEACRQVLLWMRATGALEDPDRDLAKLTF